ncbi:MAG: CRTAC1 family protein [Planctomycetes bacterium]|nr:CRTAC1 family protein [Planctomycetota bacterium]
MARGLDFTIQVGAVFPELTQPDHILMVEQMGTGAAVGDYDNDGDLDVYLLGHIDQPNRLYRNQLIETGTPDFIDVTPPELADTGLARTAQFCDLDNDGWLDLILINDDDALPTSRPSRLFRNRGGSAFDDVTAGSGLTCPGYLKGGLAVVDYDGDGWLDLYVTNWGYDSLGDGNPDFPGSNRLFRNLGGFQFSDRTGVAIEDLPTNCFAALWTDFDDDARPDLLVAVDNGRDRFYFNDAVDDFVEAGLAVGTTHIGNDMGLACADFDDDGDLDVYATNITDPTGLLGTSANNVLYVNQRSETGVLGFVDRAVERGVADTYWGWGTQFVDVDNDGDLDIAATGGFDVWIDYWFSSLSNPLFETPSVLSLNDGSGSFTRHWGTGFDDARDGRGLIAFDYDRDGDLDILITNLGSRVQLLENRTTDAGHWITVKLAPNALAWGSKVLATVDVDGPGPLAPVTKRRDVIAGRSYLSGTPAEVHFGLGRADTASIRVIWVDGTETDLGIVPANTAIVAEPL